MNICVFCSSSNAVDDVYFNETKHLGKLLGTKGHGLVYGGANVGLMNACAVVAKENNAQVIGIIPQKIHDKGIVIEIADELIVTETMSARKLLMHERSDGFITMPGGFGTLEELLEIITLKQLDYHQKPIVIVNTNGFYDLLLAQFERSYDETFAMESYRALYHVAENADEALDYIENYQHQEHVDKWFNVPEK